MTKSFTRVIENFTCERCHTAVIGNGYTNHCSACLWSKHVDNSPGDRASTCGGLMEPIEVKNKSGEWVIVHRCTTCQHIKPNKVAPNDNFDEVLAVVKRHR